MPLLLVLCLCGYVLMSCVWGVLTAGHELGAAGSTALGNALQGHTALQSLNLGGELMQQCVCA